MIVLDDGAAQVPLRKQDGSIRAYAIVDAVDAEWAGQFSWHMDAAGYAVRTVRVDGKKTTVRLNRDILNISDPLVEGDHIDRDRLNNRRGNLRPLPKIGRVNNQNQSSYVGTTSIHRGVCWDKRSGKWMAQVGANGKKHHFGRFDSEQEAAAAARKGRKRLLPFAVD